MLHFFSRSPIDSEASRHDTNSYSYSSTLGVAEYSSLNFTPGQSSFNVLSSSYVSPESPRNFIIPDKTDSTEYHEVLRSASLAELRDSFQSFSQAEKKKIDEKRNLEKNKTVKLKNHMRLLPLREHNNIRYYPVLDPLNKGSRYLMCGHCSSRHLFSHFENMKRHLKRCRPFLDYCCVNNKAAMEPQRVQQLKKDNVQPLDPILSQKKDQPPCSKPGKCHKLSQVIPNGFISVRGSHRHYDNEKQGTGSLMPLQDCNMPNNIFNHWIERKKPKNTDTSVKIRDSYLSKAPTGIPVRNGQSLTDKRCVANIDSQQEDIQNPSPRDSGDIPMIQCVHSVALDMKHVDQKDQSHSFGLTKSRLILHSDHFGDSVHGDTISSLNFNVMKENSELPCTKCSVETQTLTSYLKKKKLVQKNKVLRGDAETTMMASNVPTQERQKVVESVLKNRQRDSEHPQQTQNSQATNTIGDIVTHSIQNIRRDEHYPTGSRGSTGHAQMYPEVYYTENFKKSKSIYSPGDIVWIYNSSSFWPVLILNSMKSSLPNKNYYLVYLLNTRELQICSEGSLKSWSNGLKSWMMLSTTARRSNKDKEQAYHTARNLITKRKDEILSHIKIPEAIYSRACHFLLQGSQQWLSLDPDMCCEVPERLQDMKVNESQLTCLMKGQDMVLPYPYLGQLTDFTAQRRRCGIHSATCSSVKAEKQAIMTFLSKR